MTHNRDLERVALAIRSKQLLNEHSQWEKEMADFTMCTNQLCPEAKNCYRVQAKPNIHWQSMDFFAYEAGVNGVVCSNKIPMFAVEQTNTTIHKPMLFE